MDIQGIGIISSVGRGIEGFAKALERGPAEPSYVEVSPITKKAVPVFSVDDGVLKDKAALKNCRRADRFCKMAVLAAWDAVKDSGVDPAQEDKIGVIVSTSFGPHRTTFYFLDNILDFGDNSVSPTIFSHSVHNAAASYITSALNIKGPVSTLTDFCFPFQRALRLADAWIDQGRCQYVLVGTIDELSPAMEFICDQKLNIPDSGTKDPFSFSDNPEVIPGEGSVFFLLGKDGGGSEYCHVDLESGERRDFKDIDVCIIEDDGLIPNGSRYKDLLSYDVELFNGSAVFGGVMSGTSFHCAAGALMLKREKVFSKNTRGAVRKDQEKLSRIVCLKHGCHHESSLLSLSRSGETVTKRHYVDP